MISENIEKFFSQLQDINYDEEVWKIKEDVENEFVEIYNNYLKDGLTHEVALTKADEHFVELNQRFAKLFEHRDFINAVHRGVGIVSLCKAIVYIDAILLFAYSYVMEYVDSYLNIQAGSIQDIIAVLVLVLLIFVMFIACIIPDMKIKNEHVKYIIKHKEKGIQLGSIKGTYFLLPLVISGFALFAFLIAFVVILIGMLG